MKLEVLQPPEKSRSIRDVNGDNVGKLKDMFKEVDPENNNIRIYGNVVCDPKLSIDEISAAVEKEELNVEVIDGTVKFLRV